jgi:hypothetical protein
MFNTFIKSTAIITLAVLLGTSLPAEAKYRPGGNKARQEFLRRAKTDPLQPRHVRGFLRNQMNRRQRSGKSGFPRFKNPKGYDVGHHPMKRGSINPKDLRFEITNDNRSRPQRAKARGRRNGSAANYY